MTIDGMRKIILTRPFKPFVLYVPGDEGILLRHPDAMLVDSKSRIAILTTGDDTTIYIDLFMVSMVRVMEEAA